VVAAAAAVDALVGQWERAVMMPSRSFAARAMGFVFAAAVASGQEPTREQRLAIANGKALLVPAIAAGKPIADVFAELERATKVPIERSAVPAGAAATAIKAGQSLWDAVDQVCRAHGKLAWDVGEAGITIRADAYVRPALATASGYGVLFHGFERVEERGEQYVRSRAVVLGPPGAVVAVHHLTYTELVDDKGTNLLEQGDSGGWRLKQRTTTGNPRRLPDPDPTRPFCEAPQDFHELVPAAGATKIKSCKGTAFVRAVVELKKTAVIAGAALKDGAKAEVGGTALEIASLATTDGSVRMTIALTDARRGAKDKAFSYPELPARLVLRDATGAEVTGVRMEPKAGVMSLSMPGGNSNETLRYEVEATLPAGTTLAAVEMWEPAAVQEVKIPFACKDLAILAAK
jgi:hypothetical protein